MMARVRQGLHWLVRRDRLDADIQRGVEFHLQQGIEQRVLAGLTPAEARRTALRDFGGVDRTTEEMRDARGMTFWDSPPRTSDSAGARSPGFPNSSNRLAVGVGGALAFSRPLRSFLFATATTDVRSYLAVAAVFLAAGTVACLAPARRATTLDPLTALRTD